MNKRTIRGLRFSKLAGGFVGLALVTGLLAACAHKDTRAGASRATASTARTSADTAPSRAAIAGEKARVLHLGDSAVEIAARDPRISMHKPRARALLMTEIAGLTRLQEGTTATSADAPGLARRVAEDYAELARASDLKPDRQSAHSRAIASYEYFLKAFPNAPQRAEVEYYVGLEYELLGVREEARREFAEVARGGAKGVTVGGTPPTPPLGSRLSERSVESLVPLAHFGLGELALRGSMFEREKANDAIAEYEKVLAATNADDKIYAEALARSAEAYDRAGDHTKAEAARERVMKDFGGSEAATRMQRAGVASR